MAKMKMARGGCDLSRRVVASSGQLRPAVAYYGLLWLAAAGYKWLWLAKGWLWLAGHGSD